MISQRTAVIRIPCQRLFGTRAAARYLGISEDTLRKYTDLGWVRARYLERRRVFTLEDLDAFIESLHLYEKPQYTVGGGNPGRKEEKNGR